MRTLVVYESMWGNTRTVAEAVADGLRGAGEVDVVSVTGAPPLDTLDPDLLVVGAPTHAFGLSRPQTREDAARRGAGGLAQPGVREWIEAAPTVRLRVATFDTHVRRPNLPGSASRTAAKLLRRLGAELAARPESFYVHGYEGPVLDGELDRARAWGADLAHQTGAVPAR